MILKSFSGPNATVLTIRLIRKVKTPEENFEKVLNAEFEFFTRNLTFEKIIPQKEYNICVVAYPSRN